MKKFFKNITKKSQAKGPPTELDTGAKPSGTSSFIGYEIKEKELGKLHKAAWLNDYDKVKQLAKKDPSCLDKENRTPLHLACAQGNAKVVQELLEWKAKTNIGDNNSKTPLMKAVEGGFADCVQLLLDSHADVDAVDKEGNTCLHMACLDATPQLVTMLLKKHAKINTKNKEGLSPLHNSVMGKREDLCHLLLSQGAYVDSEDSCGRTCLMKACQEGSINLVRTLLEFGAETTHKDSKGWTADDCAVIQGHHACSQLISDHNLRQNMANRTPSSTPRSSLPPSVAATPRDKSLELGLPAMDATGDDSGEETLSKGSEVQAKGGGYDDSWGDDTDLSLAADDKKSKDSSDTEEELRKEEVPVAKVNLTKFIPHSDDGDSSRASRIDEVEEKDESESELEKSSLHKRDSTKSVQSNTSWEEGSSMLEPRKTASRVSFKKDEELSEIHDMTSPSGKVGAYVPSGISGTSMPTKPIAVEKQQAFMEELGISDADDISEADISEMSCDKKKPPVKSDDDSDWDSNVLSDTVTTPRIGILKNWKVTPGDYIEKPLERVSEHVHQEKSLETGIQAVTSTSVKTEMTVQERKEDSMSEWDSDTELVPSSTAPAVPKQPVVAHLHSLSSDEDVNTETISEWEIERKKQKEAVNGQVTTHRNEDDRTEIAKTKSMEAVMIEVEDSKWKEKVESQADVCASEDNRKLEVLGHEPVGENDENQKESDEKWSEEEIQIFFGKQQNSKWEAQNAQKASNDVIFFQEEHDEMELSEISVVRNKLPITASHAGAPSIDGEEKWIEDKVEKEDHDMRDMKSNVDTLNLSESNQKCATRSQIQTTMWQHSVNAPLQLQPPQVSTSQRLKKQLQVPSSSQVMLQNRMDDFDDEDSYASDNGNPDSPQVRDRVDVSSYYPNLLGAGSSGYNLSLTAEDDALSYTSTEFETESIVMSKAADYSSFDRDMLLNLNMNDPKTLLKLQEHHRELRQHLEHEKNQRVMLENKVKLHSTERTEFLRKVELLTQQKSLLEQAKLDNEANIRSLQYNITEEEEKRRNAEVLLEKTKDQLKRKEEKYTSSIEDKQKAELEKRNMLMELRAVNNRIRELESEHEELEQQLDHERETRFLQEKINEEQSKFQEQLQQEKVKAVSQLVENKFSEEGLEEKIDVSETLKSELYYLQAEIERQRTRFKDENALMTTENEDLHAKIDDLKHEIKLNEEALTQATMQYSVQMGSLKTEHMTVMSELEKERASVGKLETEMESLRHRLHSTTTEMEMASKAWNDLEREFQQSRVAWEKEIEIKDEDIEKMKETNRQLVGKLTAAESKVTSMETELTAANTSLLERTNQLKQIRHDLNSLQTLQDNFDQNYKLEKDHNSKLGMKIEMLQEKLSQANHESLHLKQQLENVRQATLQDASLDAQEKLNNMIMSIKLENENSRAALEGENATLTETITRLQEDLNNSEKKKSTIESDMQSLNQEQRDTVKKLSHAEASLEQVHKMKEQIEQERNHLKVEVEKLQQKYQTAHDKTVEAQARVSELVARMERAEQSSLVSSQQLVHTSANMQAFSKSKEEVEENYQRLLVENTRLEAELKHEKQQSEMLHQDLQDSQKVRSSLEALCSNLKSTNAHLEGKLGEEIANRAVLQQEVQDSKGLWEQEVVSRSKLGLRIAQLDREKQDIHESLEGEKKKSRKALDAKKATESMLEQEKEKLTQFQQENMTLKVSLKNAKKRLKNNDHSSQPRESTTDIDDIRAELEAKYRMELNKKLEEVNRYLEQQAQAQNQLDISHGENESRLAMDKKHLEVDNLDLKLKYEKAVSQCETKEMEAMRLQELYESEMKWRMRLSDLLQQTGNFKSKSQLASERHRNKFVTSFNNLNVSAISNVISPESSHLNAASEDPLSNKLRADLDRSIAKHLEAAPHGDMMPVVKQTEESSLSTSFARSSADYNDYLKRKYCVF
ncbi:ankyrin repeat domain-containing protein 26-like [Haliotis rubra]|uniref:ankyrin repeat domain-containing protein 26-like n=1 Tax=Haliotis rubra TaxID=36100 RepID=UPI001EE5BCAB|nr:ankyrin repeat domain-containing protein 26-like [Haliotis rubra]